MASVIALAVGCEHFRANAPSPDIQTVKASAHGLYRASVRPEVSPIPEKYGDPAKSGVTATVDADGSKNDFTFDLK